MARAGDKLGRHPTQSREKDGKDKQDLNHVIITASASKAGKKMTRRQRQPRDRDKLGNHGGSGSQDRNHEGRQAWENRRQRQPRAKL